MANSTGTAGGVGSPQGGQSGWDDADQAQPIPPSREGTMSAGMTGTVYDPSQEATQMAKAQTDKEKAAAASEDEAKVAPTEEVITDPAEQENFGLPDGVSTSASRGEFPEAEEPQELPNPTVEEQESSAAYIENHPEAGPAEAEPKAD